MVNAGSDIASASSITPPSTGSSFHITGTTTITAIASTNSWNGRVIVLIFDGALTFTHSSNLALPGSANITTAANDVAIMRQNASGAWRCVNYQRATGTVQAGGGSTFSFVPILSADGNGSAAYVGTHDGTRQGIFGSDGVRVIAGAYSNHAFNLRTNNTDRVQIGTAGNVTVAAPSSGIALVVDSATSSHGLQVAGDTTTGASIQFIGADRSWQLVQGGTLGGGSGGVGFYDTFSTATRLAITGDGRLYGTALHNNAGAVTGATNQYIASGTWTPTLTNSTNIDSSGTSVGQWTRVGNVVTWSLEFSVNATSASSNTELGISLPIASDFASSAQCAGTAVPVVAAVATGAGRIIGDATNNRMSLFFTSGSDVGNSGWYATGSYLIV